MKGKSYIAYKDITAVAFEKYMLLNDWERDYQFKNKNMMSFFRGEKRLAIPASERYDDFYAHLPNIIETLSIYFEKTIDDIIKEIIGSYNDRMEFRIISELSEGGKLPLGYASSCIDGIKNLILYSACAEHFQEPVCIKTTNKAKKLVDNFQLAQTDVGSFIINIDIQVVPEQYEQFSLVDLDPPLEHKVVKRISRAINQVNDVVNQKNDIHSLMEDAYQTGITANMCDAFLKMKPEKNVAEIETTIRYASALDKQIDSPETLRIGGNHFMVMNELSKIYHNTEKMEVVKLQGLITKLDNKTAKKISLATYAKGQLRTVRMELSNDDYKVACDAHRDEIQIQVEGTLDMSKKIWFLSDVENFIVLS